MIYYLMIMFSLLTLYYIFYKWRNRRYYELIAKIPGIPSRNPLVGNLDISWKNNYNTLSPSISFHQSLIAMTVIFQEKGIFRFSLGPRQLLFVFRHHTNQEFLTNNVNIGKTDEYMYLNDWLGSGLLLSSGTLWRKRRKMLTPTFHFKILEDFIPIMNEQSNILVNVLSSSLSKQFINITDVIIPCTLDMICETALGISLRTQFNPKQEYVKAIHDLGIIYSARVESPWLWPDFIFYLTQKGKQFRSYLNILHGVTRKVIIERKTEFISRKGNQQNIHSKREDLYFSKKNKKRLAFLDLLLDYHIKDNSMSLDDIQEEVDTFMFEGHDTTAISLSWTLYLLGLYPEVQIKIQEELDLIFGDNRERDVTFEDIKRMTYLECVIKESLRIYPSVPIIGRNLTEEIQIGEYIVPKGANLLLMIDRLHMDPHVFPSPLEFKPERFLAENSSDRNPFAYVPFSAGPRSCIGQKFALLEEKVVLSKIFLNFNLQSLDARDKIISSAEMVFRPHCPIRIKLFSRNAFNL